MPRIARVVAVGYPHHITQRGNYQQSIFQNDVDKERYLSLVKSESAKYGFTILAYCLMTNHVHFIGVPGKIDSLGNVFKYVNMKYSQYFNNKMGISGHLFQGRFFSSVMDERYTIICARYIERNPVRAKMVKKAVNYGWSSANVHCGKEAKDILGVNVFFEYVGELRNTWQEFIEQPDNLNEIAQIKKKTAKGRPLGEESFIKKLEKKVNRVLTMQPAGRPKENGK